MSHQHHKNLKYRFGTSLLLLILTACRDDHIDRVEKLNLKPGDFLNLLNINCHALHEGRIGGNGKICVQTLAITDPLLVELLRFAIMECINKRSRNAWTRSLDGHQVTGIYQTFIL
jgi:hypothetical protein